MQALEPGLKDEGLVRDQLDQGFGDAMRDPDRVPIAAIVALPAVKPPTQRRVARIGDPCIGHVAGAACDGQIGCGNFDLRAQPIHRQPPQQVIGQPRIDIDQQPAAIGHDQKIGQILALWRQQRRPSGQITHLVGDKPLQKGDPILARNRQYASHHLSPNCSLTSAA